MAFADRLAASVKNGVSASNRGRWGLDGETSSKPKVSRMTVPKSRPSRRAIVMSSLAGTTSGMLSQAAPVESSQTSERGIDGPSRPSDGRKITVERHGQICLIGLNRPNVHNRVDPEAFSALARAYAAYDADDDLRAAVLFGHGENFTRGIDVDAFALWLVQTPPPAATG